MQHQTTSPKTSTSIVSNNSRDIHLVNWVDLFINNIYRGLAEQVKGVDKQVANITESYFRLMMVTILRVVKNETGREFLLI